MHVFCITIIAKVIFTSFSGKSLAWRVMELVNPNLFYEACEAGMGSSHSSNLDSQGSRSDDQM